MLSDPVKFYDLVAGPAVIVATKVAICKRLPIYRFLHAENANTYQCIIHSVYTAVRVNNVAVRVNG
jgi:antitoxin component of RelBE/YafQ-DinJ toxin-antitoxin module